MPENDGKARILAASTITGKSFDITDKWDELLAERDRLRDAIEEYALWEPGRRGHAAAHRKLLAAARNGTETSEGDSAP